MGVDGYVLSGLLPKVSSSLRVSFSTTGQLTIHPRLHRRLAVFALSPLSPPFESLSWDNSFIGSLFDCDYVWERFFPRAKRRWGWYVLPIFFGDRFVRRIEPRIDADKGPVEVLGLLNRIVDDA